MFEFDLKAIEDLQRDHGVSLLHDDLGERQAIRLGEGRSAVVYDATQRKAVGSGKIETRSVALRASVFLRSDQSSGAYRKEHASLEQAAQILDKLPGHVVRILDGPWPVAGASADYLVTLWEKCDYSLHDLLSGQHQDGMTRKETQHFLEPIASVLDSLHDQSLVHRDVKPDNILIHHGNAKLADFGLLRERSGTASVTAFGGTVDFTPPEFSAGTGQALPASDAWAFGMTYFRTRCGSNRRPFLEGLSHATVASDFVLDGLEEDERAALQEIFSVDPKSRPTSLKRWLTDMKAAQDRWEAKRQHQIKVDRDNARTKRPTYCGEYLLPGDSSRIRQLGVSRDEKVVVATGETRRVVAYEAGANSAKQLWNAESLDGQLRSGAIAFSPSDKLVAVAWHSRLVDVFERDTGKLHCTLDCGPRKRLLPWLNDDNRPYDLTFLNEDQLATGDNTTLRVWDLNAVSQIDKLNLKSGCLLSLVENAPRDSVLVGTEAGDLVESTQGESRVVTRIKGGWITGLGCTSDGEFALVGGRSGELFKVHLDSGNTTSFGNMKGQILKLSVHPSFDLVAVAVANDSARVFCTHSGQQLYTLEGPKSRSLSFSKRGSELLSVGVNCGVHRYSWDSRAVSKVPSSFTTASGCQWPKELSNNNDGTFYHASTGLTWMIPLYGEKWSGNAREGNAISLSWHDAAKLFGEARRISSSGMPFDLFRTLKQSGGLSLQPYTDYRPGSKRFSFAGNDDWRLPTIEEIALTFGVEGLPSIAGPDSVWSANGSNLDRDGSPAIDVSLPREKLQCAWWCEGGTAYADITCTQRYPIRLVRGGSCYLEWCKPK